MDQAGRAHLRAVCGRQTPAGERKPACPSCRCTRCPPCAVWSKLGSRCAWRSRGTCTWRPPPRTPRTVQANGRVAGVGNVICVTGTMWLGTWICIFNKMPGCLHCGWVSLWQRLPCCKHTGLRTWAGAGAAGAPSSSSSSPEAATTCTSCASSLAMPACAVG